MNLRDIEVEFLKWLETFRSDALTSFVNGVNFTGDVLFFTIMLPIIYWLFSKRAGIILALTMFVSLFTNVILKDLFQVLRPFQAYDISSTIEQGGYSFPSGHAQHSFSFWMMIALLLRNRWFWLVSIVMIVLVGFARMYSGVHFPLDILGGWAIGTIVVLIFYQIHKTNLLLRLRKSLLVASASVLALLAIAVYELIAGTPLDHEGAYQAAGLLIFTLIGYVLENRYIKFEIKGSILLKLFALILGVIGLLAIKEGFKLILPDHVWSDFIRYGLLAFWTFYIAPLLFITFKLAYRKL